MPIIDESVAVNVAGGDASLARILLETCIDDAPNLIESAKTKVIAGDFDDARMCGHSLRSSFSAIGAMIAAETAMELEYCETNDVDMFNDAIKAVEGAYSQMVDAAKSTFLN